MFVSVHVGRDWEELQARLLASPDWMPKIIRSRMDKLQPIIVDKMKGEVSEHRYTGSLETSIEGKIEQSPDVTTLTVNPTVMRGRWDGGTLLELGTGPIPNAPWLPIAKWAEFRGLPAFPVWYKIRHEGINEHPFIDRTLNESMGAIEWTALEIASGIAEAIARADVTP